MTNKIINFKQFLEEGRRGPGSGSNPKENTGNTTFEGGQKPTKKIESEEEELSTVDVEPSEEEKASLHKVKLNRKNTKDSDTRKA